MKNFTHFYEDFIPLFYVSKKELLVLLTLFLVTFGHSQSVGDTFIDDFKTYEVTSVSPNTVAIIDYDHSSLDANIPATVTNNTITYDVTSIAQNAFNYSGPSANKLNSVTFSSPSSILTIGTQAFRDQNLTTVTIPSSVNSIGQYAFWHNNLTSVTLENGIESIDAHAFSTNQLVDIIIPDSVISIGQAAFQNNQLTSATLSNSLTSIEGSVFQINQLQSIVIPNSVTSISGAAFGTNQLTSLTLSNNLTFIGAGAFRSNNLTHVTIPSTVTDIENSAFRDNFNLATVTSQAINPPTIFVPGINDTFYNRAAIDLTIPASTSAAYAAGGWTGFNSVTEASALAVGDTFVVNFITYEVTSVAPETVKAIDYDTTGGTTVDIPATVSHSVSNYDVTSIGAGAFFNKNLTHVTIPNNVTDIELHAFHTNQLTDIIIPESVNNIGSQAFISNPLSTVVVLGTTPPTINTSTNVDTFSQNGDRSNIDLIVINNATDEYVTDPGALWTGFKMVFEATSPTTAEVSHYDSANGTNVVIPSTVTAGSNTFDVNRIDDSAFENTGLTSVIIPDSVIEIGVSAFNTNNLTSVTIPDSVTLIGTTAFATNPITNLSIGSNVTDIAIGAFVDNNLSNVTIPSNVTFIGLLAFGNNPLSSVTSLATTPPTITTGTNDTFAFDRSNIALSIPAGTMGAYVTDPGALWTGFNPVTEDALSIDEFELGNTVKIITQQNRLEIVTNEVLQLNRYEVYALTGAKIATGNTFNISTETWAKGIYILKLDFDNRTVVRKVVVQ